jgi:hypothetical protein
MTDQLDDLFRDLRAETLTTVRPPGAVEARRTLRRRRRNRAVGAAACLVAAGFGGVGTHLLGPAAEPDVGDRPDQAAAVVEPTVAARFSGQGAAVSAVVASGVVLAGRYTLALSCVGPGRVTLTVRVGGAEMGSTSARCADGRLSSADFSMPDTLTATAEMRAEDGAAGQAGYAYAMTLMDADRDRLAADVVSALPEPEGTVAYRRDGSPVGPATASTALDPGRYRVALVCRGTGEITVTLRLTQHTQFYDLTCDPFAFPQQMPLDVPADGNVSVEVVPDAQADRQSAYALRIERR